MNTSNQMDDIRRQNRANILASLRTHGSVSRTTIASLTGLSAATVSTITADLLAGGILVHAEEISDAISGRGRPRVNLSFNADYACVGVFVIQFNRLYFSLVDYCGQTIYVRETSLVTTAISAGELLDILVKSVNCGLDEISGTREKLKHIGVCIQGTSDVLETTMLWSPVIQPRNVPIGEHLKKEFAVSVTVHNDCNIIAKSLRYKEPEIFQTDFAAVLLSQGIGIGLYQNGELVRGRNSSGTEFGHMTYIPGGALCRCGRRGCIEAYAGGYGIYRNANKQKQDAAPQDDITLKDMEDIWVLARKGDEVARHAFEEAGAAIGIGLANLFALIDPFPVAIVGLGARASDLLEKTIRKTICDSNMHPDIEKIPIVFYHDENPFMQDGCALTALSAVDENISSTQTRTPKRAQRYSQAHASDQIGGQ